LGANSIIKGINDRQYKAARANGNKLTNLAICYRKKQIDASYSWICPVINHEFRYNIVKVAVDP